MTDNALQHQRECRSLAERYRSRACVSGDACLLLDISGSMNSDCEPGTSKISALRKIVAGIAGNPTVFVFSSRVQKIDKDNIPNPNGSTYMSHAFIAAKEAGFKSAIMITDGEASDPDAALGAVEGLKVQVLYVGPGPKSEFLDRLAAKAGSYCTQDDLSKPKEILEKLRLLLTPGREDSKGAICL